MAYKITTNDFRFELLPIMFLVYFTVVSFESVIDAAFKVTVFIKAPDFMVYFIVCST